MLRLNSSKSASAALLKNGFPAHWWTVIVTLTMGAKKGDFNWLRCHSENRQFTVIDKPWRRTSAFDSSIGFGNQYRQNDCKFDWLLLIDALTTRRLEIHKDLDFHYFRMNFLCSLTIQGSLLMRYLWIPYVKFVNPTQALATSQSARYTLRPWSPGKSPAASYRPWIF